MTTTENTASSHVISGNLDMLLGEEKYLPWSCSRMEVASSCLYKFNQVYLAGIKEESAALTLGGLSHEIIADLLKDGEPSEAKAEIFLTRHYPIYRDADANGEALATVRSFFPYMVEFCTKWNNFLNEKGIKKARVEHPYGLTRDLERASYNPNNPIRQTYLRGIIDLWAYDPETQYLYIVDHKTNKSIMSSNKVKEHIQLNLYIAMLARIYKLKWKKAFIGLNFLRKKKTVWATVEPHETAVFTDIFMNTLRYLEARLFDCENSLVWPAERSFKCSWCALKSTCLAFNSEV